MGDRFSVKKLAVGIENVFDYKKQTEDVCSVNSTALFQPDRRANLLERTITYKMNDVYKNIELNDGYNYSYIRYTNESLSKISFNDGIYINTKAKYNNISDRMPSRTEMRPVLSRTVNSIPLKPRFED